MNEQGQFNKGVTRYLGSLNEQIMQTSGQHRNP